MTLKRKKSSRVVCVDFVDDSDSPEMNDSKVKKYVFGQILKFVKNGFFLFFYRMRKIQ